MRLNHLALVASLSTISQAQEQTTVSGTTYTGCHDHGSTAYCYGPDGEETPITAAPLSTTASATATGQTTAVTSCHAHDEEVFCIDGDGHEVEISFEATPTGELPAAYTNCHAHDAEQYCVDPDGNDVLILAEGAEEEHSHPLDESSSSEGQDCHFHAGVE
jgi:solute carrier family 39 (zinc transporter), member 1/2/3